MERKWAVVAFGDIRGFGAWTSRAASSREVKDPFLLEFYAQMDAYVLKHRDVHFKRTGDGFMALREFAHGKNGKAIAEFILTLRCLTRKCRRALGECRYPRPDGFRVRIMCGDVYKIMVIDSNDPQRKRMVPEYVEYPTNGASHLLQVNPEIVALATEGVVAEMGDAGKVFRVRKLIAPSCYPTSVNKADVDGLHILKF